MITMAKLNELFAAIRIAANATDQAIATSGGGRAMRAEQSARAAYAYALARFAESQGAS